LQLLETILAKNTFEKTKTLMEACSDISQNRHNSLTTTYYLTLKRFVRQGGKSIADITKYNNEKIVKQMINEQESSSAYQQEIR
jgi:hypothetical protein